MTTYEEFLADLARRRRERWAKILASEPPGRAAGRRPRDPDQERLLLRLDRARLARRAAAGDLASRRVPAPDPPPTGADDDDCPADDDDRAGDPA